MAVTPPNSHDAAQLPQPVRFASPSPEPSQPASLESPPANTPGARSQGSAGSGSHGNGIAATQRRSRVPAASAPHSVLADARPRGLPPHVPSHLAEPSMSGLQLTMSPSRIVRHSRKKWWSRRASIKEISALGALSDSDDRGNSPLPPHVAAPGSDGGGAGSGAGLVGRTPSGAVVHGAGTSVANGQAQDAVGEAADDADDAVAVQVVSAGDNMASEGMTGGDTTSDSAAVRGSTGHDTPGTHRHGRGHSTDAEADGGVAGVAVSAHLVARARQQEEMGYNSVSFDWTKSLTDAQRNRPSLVNQLENVQNVLLMWVDPALASHLRDLGVCPPMYLLRWLRLAFVREFSVVRVALLAPWVVGGGWWKQCTHACVCVCVCVCVCHCGSRRCGRCGMPCWCNLRTRLSCWTTSPWLRWCPFVNSYWRPAMHLPHWSTSQAES